VPESAFEDGAPGVVHADRDRSETPPSSVRVMIADDNAVIRMGLRMLLSAESAVDLVAEAADGIQALELARSERPDVVLLDVRMPGLSGLDVLAELAELCCVLMLTSSEEDETVWAAMRAGARGYLVYGTFDETAIVQNILAAVGGGSVLSPPAARALMNVQDKMGRSAAPARVPAVDGETESSTRRHAVRPEISALLSEREVGVMRLLVAGQTNAEIAKALFLAPKTVKNHINRIFTKLQVTTRAQAIATWLGTADSGETAQRSDGNG
jgi:DNA-binding NarL/FixJ family response regulator